MNKLSDFRAFGKNDIRGIYGEDVTEELFYYTGRGFVKYVLEQLNKEVEEKNKTDVKDVRISVCMDVRTHSPSLQDALIKGVTSTGANVLNLGIAPTPLGYF
jgi:phosphomannomutase